MKHIVIIGGGASGLMAALYAKTASTKVTILERNTMCGKKILATGNGKCNYWNENQTLSHYNSTNKDLLENIINEDNNKEIITYFNSLGIVPKIKNGYYYPFTNQATTIRDVLVRETTKKGVVIRTEYLVEKIVKEENSFKIYSSNEVITADKVIIATGSKASPKTGSDGLGYHMLRELEHRYIEPLPALVQLKTKGSYLKEWAGIRTDVEVSLYEDNKFLKKESGEIQLTDYGISGICVFNLSRHVSIGLLSNKKEVVKINFLPFTTKEKVSELFKTTDNIKLQLSNILNNKLSNIILQEAKINENKRYQELSTQEQEKLHEFLTEFPVEVIGTNSFDQAQVCSGGIPLTDINLKTMESKIIKNLFIVGELLDIDGDCGGYNLTVAWITGMLAGKGSANSD